MCGNPSRPSPCFADGGCRVPRTFLKGTTDVTSAFRSSLLLGVAACLSSCRSPPEPLPLRSGGVFTGVDYFIGEPLGRVQRGPLPDLDAGGLWGIACTVYALAERVDGEFEPLAERIALIAEAHGTDPIAAVPRLAIGARFAQIDDVDAFVDRVAGGGDRRVALMTRHFAVLPRTATAAFRWAPLVQRSLQRVERKLLLHRGEGAGPEAPLEIALVLDGWVREPELGIRDDDADDDDAEGETPPPPAPPTFQRESVQLLPLTGGLPRAFALLLDPFQYSSAAGVLIVVEVRSLPEWGGERQEEIAAAISSCRARLSQGEEIQQIDPDEAETWPGLLSAFDDLQIPRRRRGALVYLSRSTGTSITEAVALSADDRWIESIAARLSERPQVHLPEEQF